MKTLESVIFTPSGFDSRANYAGETEFPGLLFVLARNRDSDELAESNWRVALKNLGGESETVQIIRIGHWACGWVEYLCVKEGSEQQETAQDMVDQLKDYPILDEEDFGQLEQEEADRVWRDCFSYTERVAYMRSHWSQFEPQTFEDLLGCARGRYFIGYASELLH